MKRKVHRCIHVTVIVIGVICAISAVLYFWLDLLTPGPWEQVNISTATKGGTYNVLGSQLSRILERLPGKPIKHVKAEQSRGSQENIQRLIDSESDIALVQGPSLIKAAKENPAVMKKLSILARLYTDIVQVVVRKNAGIKTLSDLKNKRIYIGAKGSGTRLLAKHILETIGLNEDEYFIDDAISYTDSAKKLVNGEIDAAIYTAGTPTEATRTALESGYCDLLSLKDTTIEQLSQKLQNIGLIETQISMGYYPNQPRQIQTVGADVYLVCRRDLPEVLASTIVEALFDNITDLLLAHTIAQDIELTSAFKVPEGLSLHPGSSKFKEKEDQALLIATGAVNGKYHNMGMMIQLLLKERGIHARAIHTGGSLANAVLLKKRPTIAIIQYDAALSSRFGQPKFIYGENFSYIGSIPEVKKICRIAVLHEEKLHIIMRREKLSQIEDRLKWKPETISTLSELSTALKKIPSNEERLKVCLGARNSATQVIAQAVLSLHNINLNSIISSYLSVSDMVNRLHSGEIDIGFFMSYVPGEATKTILDNQDIRLLSLGSKETAPLAGNVFTTAAIKPCTYGCQKENETEIHTIASKAVLVTTEDLPFDVRTITQAIFEGEAFLGIKGGKVTMSKDLGSLPLHLSAREYYQKADLLPSKPPIDWLKIIWRFLAILVILIGGYNGLLKLRRDRTNNRIGRRIFAISTQASVQDSVDKLLDIRDEIQERVRRRWWRLGELDKPRWRYLFDLINDRIQESKDSLTQAFVSEIQSIDRKDGFKGTKGRENSIKLEKQIWGLFEKGELNAEQCKLLLDIIEKRLS